MPSYEQDAHMSLPHGPPLLLGLLLGPLLGALAWGFWRSRRGETGDSGPGISDDVLLVFVLLAALAIGASLAYIFLVVDA
jgi:hypothetical protein